MEEKNKSKKLIIDAVVTSLISSIILIIVNSSIYWFYKEKANISISSSTFVDNQYITVINIKNYQKSEAISEINLWFNNNEIKKTDTNLKNSYDKITNNIKIEGIMPEYTGSIILYSEKEINEQNLKIELDEKANVVFLSSQRESAYIQIEKYLGTAFVYFLEFTVMLIIDKRYYDKKRREAQDECNRLEVTVKMTENRVNELLKQQSHIKLKLQKRIIDYSKELSFWKDTIRKLLYQSKENKITDNEVFQIVTKNLKTYQTLEKCNYEDIEDAINEIKNIEE